MQQLNSAKRNREIWLQKAIAEFRPMFKAIEHPLPRHIRVACGYPLGKRSAIGQCWSSETSTDGAVEIFISPELDRPAKVLGVLCHELVHAATAVSGHGPKFRRPALAIGLCGKMTATGESPELITKLKAMIKRIGTYPHAKANGKDGKKKRPGSRLIKCECMDCHYVARVARKWIFEAGAPICPTHDLSMSVAE